MIETDRERADFDASWDTATLPAGETFDCRFAEPAANAAGTPGVRGTVPAITVWRATLHRYGVTIQSRIEAVTTHDGRVRGPYIVTTVNTIDDGVFAELRLRETT